MTGREEETSQKAVSEGRSVRQGYLVTANLDYL